MSIQPLLTPDEELQADLFAEEILRVVDEVKNLAGRLEEQYAPDVDMVGDDAVPSYMAIALRFLTELHADDGLGLGRLIAAAERADQARAAG